MSVYYNELDPFCCRVLQARVADGGLPEGFVDERDIRDVRATDLVGHAQCHMFAGVGGFGLAARWADIPDDFNLWTGGFPCQDISAAGKGEGIYAARSGLWWEMRRLVSDVRPAWLLLENVPRLRTLGADEVLESLEELGYACWPLVVGAEDIGAPHRRKRVWIVAHAERGRRGPGSESTGRAARGESARQGAGLADSWGSGREWWQGSEDWGLADGTDAGRQEGADQPASAGAHGLADADGLGREGVGCGGLLDRLGAALGNDADRCGRWPARPGEPQHEWEYSRLADAARKSARGTGQPREGTDSGRALAGLGGSASRLPGRLAPSRRRDELRAYGNAIVPQVAAEVIRAMVALDADMRRAT